MDELEQTLRLRAKKELRKRLLGLRKTLSVDGARGRSAEVVARVVAHPAFDAAREVAVFFPMESRREIDLRPLVSTARERGKVIACPWIGDGSAPVCFREVVSDDALVTTPIGALEPPADARVLADVDLIVVPALAVDLDGHRLGYGGGYYDRLIAAHPRATTIAVVFDFQILAEIPTLAHDQRVQHVATDVRVVKAGDHAALTAPATTTEPGDELGVVRVVRPR